ncbi:MAG: cell division protein ZipA [Wenzhouxiangellaceae bacterium]|nr:cell division protein ZipA [Wenzhouxiangellaceae bacterium]
MSADGLRLILILIGALVLGLIWMFYRPEGRERRAGASRKREARRDPVLKVDGAVGKSNRAGDETAAASAAAGVSDENEPDEPRQASLPEFGPVEPAAPSLPPKEGTRPGPPASSRTVAAEPEPAGSGMPPDEQWREPTAAAGERRPASKPVGAAGSDKRVVNLYLKTRGDARITGAALLDAAIKAGLRFGEMKIFHRRHRGEDLPVFSMANLERPGSFDPSAWNLFESRGVSLFMTVPGPVSALDAWDAMLATGQRLAGLLDADLLDDGHHPLSRQRIAEIREELRDFDRRHAP